MLSNHVAEFFEMTFYCFFTWCDDGFEAKGMSMLVCHSRMCFSHRKLAYRPSQEIEPHISLIAQECMGHFRFARLQFQSHVG